MLPGIPSPDKAACSNRYRTGMVPRNASAAGAIVHSAVRIRALGASMYREWLLTAWIGTTSNFTLLSYHSNHPGCQQALAQARREITSDQIRLECRQSMREGRSQYIRRPGSHGIATR